MGANTHGKFSVKGMRGTMEAYDALPPEFRKLLQDAPFNIAADNIAEHIAVGLTTEMVERKIAKVMRESARLTYGKDHPQAK